MVPAIIAVLIAVSFLLSNYQKELGISKPNNGGRAAVAAAAVALELSSGADVSDYAAFSDAVLVAVVARRSVPITNAADTRLDHRLAEILDCLSAAREAWQTEIDGTWNDHTHGVATYWTATHPAAGISGDALTAADVRAMSVAEARDIIEQAAELAD